MRTDSEDNYWRAGASQPSRTTGTIYIYIVGRVHILHIYTHARNLRETPTRHLYPLPFAIYELERPLRQPKAGDASSVALRWI